MLRGQWILCAQPLPIAKAFALRVIAEEAGLCLAAQATFRFHPEKHVINGRIGIGFAHSGFRGTGNFSTQINRGFIHQLQGANRKAQHARGIIHHRRRDTFGHQANAFIDIGDDAAIGVKKPRIVYNDGRFANLPHVI